MSPLLRLGDPPGEAWSIADGDALWHVSILLDGTPLRAASVLARRGTDTAIFDTGLPCDAGSLLAALAGHGLAADDVTLVFNTHAHIDHSHNNALFPRARIFGSARDRAWTRAFYDALARIDHPDAEDVRPFYPEIALGRYEPKLVRKVLAIEKLVWDVSRWGRANQFVPLEDAQPPAGITIVQTPGHAPHHVSFVIQTRARPVLVCGDALLRRDEGQDALPLVPPHDLAMYQRSRALVCAFDGIIVPGHDASFDHAPLSLRNMNGR